MGRKNLGAGESAAVAVAREPVGRETGMTGPRPPGMTDRRSQAPSFFQRRIPRPGADGRPVLAVGGRVLVTGAAGVQVIALSDDHGIPNGKTVATDIEVEIVAWMPRGPNGARYRVRRAEDGVEGWVDAPSLRPPPAPPAPPRPAPAALPHAARGAKPAVARKRSR